jgi:hypothetical protein
MKSQAKETIERIALLVEKNLDNPSDLSGYWAK